MSKHRTKWGEDFTVEIIPDQDADKPWEQGDGLGIVEDRDAALTMGENYIQMPNGYVFSWSETMKKARKEEWGRPSGKAYSYKKYRDKTQAAVQQQLDRFTAWLNNEWHYVGVVVTHDESGKNASLWGIEDDNATNIEETIDEMIDEACPLNEFERKVFDAARS